MDENSLHLALSGLGLSAVRPAGYVPLASIDSVQTPAGQVPTEPQPPSRVKTITPTQAAALPQAPQASPAMPSSTTSLGAATSQPPSSLSIPVIAGLFILAGILLTLAAGAMLRRTKK